MQRGPLRPGGLSQRQRVHKSAHRPYFSEESGAAADHGADHLQASGRKLPGGAGGQLHDAGLGHHGRAAKGPVPEIRKKKNVKEHGANRALLRYFSKNAPFCPLTFIVFYPAFSNLFA